jgi:hypothetical protein
VDERDKDLTNLFVRDLDEIPLPPRGAWRRGAGGETILMRSSRYLLTAGAVMAVLALALIVGFQLSQRQQSAANPSASPTPSASGATAANPSASPSGTATAPVATNAPASGGAIFNDDFGFVVTAGNAGMRIRSESSNASVGTFPGVVFAVSPDGTQIAYFTTAGPQQLRIFRAAGNANEQTLTTLAAGARGGGIAWSSDGTGLVYSIESGTFIGGGPNSATLNIYDLNPDGPHAATIDTQNNTGWVYRPLAWDRTTNLVAAGLTGDGGYMGKYVTVRLNADHSFTAVSADTSSRGMLMGQTHASTDGKFVLGVSLTSGDLVWWPVNDYGAAKTEPGAGKRGALWRPGTHEIGFMSGEQLWLGDIDKAGAQGLCCTAFSGAPATSTLRMFRADGSAVVLTVQFVPTGSPPPVSQTQYTLVRIGSDPKSTAGDRVNLQDVAELMGSVRLH